MLRQGSTGALTPLQKDTLDAGMRRAMAVSVGSDGTPAQPVVLVVADDLGPAWMTRVLDDPGPWVFPFDQSATRPEMNRTARAFRIAAGKQPCVVVTNSDTIAIRYAATLNGPVVVIRVASPDGKGTCL